LRINRPSDDPAGLALADTLRADTAKLGQAVRNTNNAISLVSTTVAALDEINNILVRLGELAQQSSNGINTPTSRIALQEEFTVLGSEISRIATSVEFNNIKLLTGNSPTQFPMKFQVGIDGSDNSQVEYGGVSATLNAFSLADANENLSYSINDNTALEGQAAARTALVAVKAAMSQLSVKRGAVSAVESRLSFAVNQLQNEREVKIDAESQIRDVDIAQETANFLGAKVQRDAAAAVLAQANQDPATVAKLLGIN
jgi:flagellin